MQLPYYAVLCVGSREVVWLVDQLAIPSTEWRRLVTTSWLNEARPALRQSLVVCAAKMVGIC